MENDIRIDSAQHPNCPEQIQRPELVGRTDRANQLDHHPKLARFFHKPTDNGIGLDSPRRHAFKSGPDIPDLQQHKDHRRDDFQVGKLYLSPFQDC
jgi:hypothetical protein